MGHYINSSLRPKSQLTQLSFGINTLSNTLAIQCQNCLALVNLPRTRENSQIHSHHLHIISRSQARKSSLIRTPRLSVLHQPHPHTPSQLLHPPNRYCTFEGHPHLPQSDNTASTQNCYCQRTGFVTRTPTSPQADHGPQQAESHPSPHHKPLSMANTRPDVASTMPHKHIKHQTSSILRGQVRSHSSYS